MNLFCHRDVGNDKKGIETDKCISKDLQDDFGAHMWEQQGCDGWIFIVKYTKSHHQPSETKWAGHIVRTLESEPERKSWWGNLGTERKEAKSN